jgi:hypothetical protein
MSAIIVKEKKTEKQRETKQNAKYQFKVEVTIVKLKQEPNP